MADATNASNRAGNANDGQCKLVGYSDNPNWTTLFSIELAVKTADKIARFPTPSHKVRTKTLTYCIALQYRSISLFQILTVKLLSRFVVFVLSNCLSFSRTRSARERRRGKITGHGLANLSHDQLPCPFSSLLSLFPLSLLYTRGVRAITTRTFTNSIREQSPNDPRPRWYTTISFTDVYFFPFFTFERRGCVGGKNNST